MRDRKSQPHSPIEGVRRRSKLGSASEPRDVSDRGLGESDAAIFTMS
jgi:hypothetical protein